MRLYDYHLHWVSTGKSSLDFKLLTKWIKDAFVRRDNIVCKKPNQWCMDMVTLDVVDGLKVHGLSKGVFPWRTLFGTMDAMFILCNAKLPRMQEKLMGLLTNNMMKHVVKHII